ncbi:hypothetical protein Glove_490g36 [Diversispora epigaea]|uniref:Uncharacterized protein n=1 Tax=Diversispora epigaea TaxID=1348612 RepID=A0A397GMB6_9GLOM|nr:hypothetical protein Glove_490g36 [Diversispora epigaea]
MKNGNLRDYLKQNKSLPWIERLWLLNSFIRGLKVIHSKGVIHHDLQLASDIYSVGIIMWKNGLMYQYILMYNDKTNHSLMFLKADQKMQDDEDDLSSAAETVHSEAHLTMMNIMFEKLFYAGPVTSLCFHNDDILFSGEGPYLKAFSVTTGKLINSSMVLEYFRIHRIVPVKFINKSRNSQSYTERRLLAIYGSKIVKFIEAVIIYYNNNNRDDDDNGDTNNCTVNCTFNLISKLPPLKDWIHDIHWLYDDMESIIKSISQISELELSSSKLSKLELPSELAIAFAHNFVEIWNIIDNCCLYSVQCEERCILYSARFFGDNKNDLVLASGTVFNQVLLWKIISKNEQHEQQGVDQRVSQGVGVIYKKFIGHEGIIFGVRFSNDGKLVASVSDDRTIRLWQTDDIYNDKPKVLYGHMARIWDCYITDDYLISISEDSTCRVWKNSFTNNSNNNNDNDKGDLSDVDCLACWEGHVGKNVWSLAINPSRKIVATGGGDSGLRLWSLSSITVNKIDSEKDLIKICLPPSESYLSYIQQNMNLPSREHIRNFLLIDYRVIVISTNFGHILKHNNLTNEWKPLYNSTNLHNYTMMKASNCGRIVCCGSIYGHLYIISVNQEFQTLEKKLHDFKVFEIFLEETEDENIIYIISHAVQNDISLLKFDFNNNKPILEILYKLNVPSQFLLMSLAFCPSYNILVCGSRDSGLVIYNLNQSPSTPINELSPIIYLDKIHGKQSVTSIALKVENLVINSSCVHHHESTDDFTDNDMKVLIIYTTGRDGCYAKYRLKGITNKYNKNNKYDVNTTESSQNLKEDYNKSLMRSYIDEDGDDKRSYIDEDSDDDDNNHNNNKKQKLNKKDNNKSGEAAVIVLNHGLILEEVYRAKITKGWLEKVLFVDDELMLLGFYRKRFFVYNEFKKFQIFSVACGGAHRVWHFKAQDKKMNKASFMFIRKENVFIYSRETHDNQGFDECELQRNFHGRECRTVKFLKNDQNKAIIFATGAEDSILRLFQYIPDNIEGCLVNLCRIKKHTSVIRSIEWSYGKGLLLFSSGASEELVCWKVEVKFKNDTIIENSLNSQVADVNCLEWALCPAISEIPETRIMDISVFSIVPSQGIHIIAAGYSDSALRVWLFDEESREFLLIGYAKYHFKCILQVEHLIIKAFNEMNTDGIIIFTVATDGRIAIFDISQVVFKILDTYKNENTSFTHQNLGDPIYSYQAHQSGVNCISIHKISKNSKNITTSTFERFITTFMIATGGEDNAIAIKFLDITISLLYDISIQIINDTLLFSISLDQHLNLWKIPYLDSIGSKESKNFRDNIGSNRDNDQEFQLIKSEFINVHDISSMDISNIGDSGEMIISITGIGIELLKF